VRFGPAVRGSPSLSQYIDTQRVYSLLQSCSVSWWRRFFLYLSHPSPSNLATSYSQNVCYFTQQAFV